MSEKFQFCVIFAWKKTRSTKEKAINVTKKFILFSSLWMIYGSNKFLSRKFSKKTSSKTFTSAKIRKLNWFILFTKKILYHSTVAGNTAVLMGLFKRLLDYFGFCCVSRKARTKSIVWLCLYFFLFRSFVIWRNMLSHTQAMYIIILKC